MSMNRREFLQLLAIASASGLALTANPPCQPTRAQTVFTTCPPLAMFLSCT